jgi:hypothetical protein
MLAEMYDVPGVREWLVEESINAENFCAACEFGLLLEGEPEGDRNDLFRECIDFAKQPETYDMEFNKDGLVGVGYKTMDWLLGAAMNYEKECTSAVMIERGFNFLDKWWAANGGEPGCERGEEVDGLVALLGNLTCLSFDFLKNNVRPSGLVSAERMNEIYEEKLGQAAVVSTTLSRRVTELQKTNEEEAQRVTELQKTNKKEAAQHATQSRAMQLRIKDSERKLVSEKRSCVELRYEMDDYKQKLENQGKEMEEMRLKISDYQEQLENQVHELEDLYYDLDGYDHALEVERERCMEMEATIENQRNEIGCLQPQMPLQYENQDPRRRVGNRGCGRGGRGKRGWNKLGRGGQQGQ